MFLPGGTSVGESSFYFQLVVVWIFEQFVYKVIKLFPVSFYIGFKGSHHSMVSSLAKFFAYCFVVKFAVKLYYSHTFSASVVVSNKHSNFVDFIDLRFILFEFLPFCIILRSFHEGIGKQRSVGRVIFRVTEGVLDFGFGLRYAFFRSIRRCDFGRCDRALSIVELRRFFF